MRYIQIAPKLETGLRLIIVRIALKNVERGKQLTLQLLKYMDIGKYKAYVATSPKIKSAF